MASATLSGSGRRLPPVCARLCFGKGLGGEGPVEGLAGAAHGRSCAGVHEDCVYVELVQNPPQGINPQSILRHLRHD